MNREWSAVLPAYDEYGGNICLLYDLHGNVIQSKNKMVTTMDHLYDLELVDLKRQFKLLQMYSGKKKYLPYIYGKDRIFIAIKIRQPIGKNDGAYGYIRIDQIKEVHGDTLLLNSNLEIKYIDPIKTLEKRIQEGKIASLVLEERHFIFENPCTYHPS